MPASTRKRYHVWHLDFTDDTTNVSQPPRPARNATTRAALDEHSTPPGFPSTLSSRDPSALQALLTAPSPKSAASSPSSPSSSPSPAAVRAAYKDAWSAAFSPLRAILTSAFALYMAGSSVQFFSVASTVTVLFMHVRALLAAADPFRTPVAAGRLRLSHVVLPFLVHALLCLAGVALGLAKANDLGFLPTTESDYVALLPSYTVAPSAVRFAPPL